AARAEDPQRGVHRVQDPVVGPDGVDDDAGAPRDDLGAQVVALVLAVAHRRAHHLRPELGVPRPGEPPLGPAVLHVAGPGDDLPQPPPPTGAPRLRAGPPPPRPLPCP